MNSSSEAAGEDSVHREATIGSQVTSIGIYLGVLIILITITYILYCIYKCLKANDGSPHSGPPSRRRRSSDYSTDSGEIYNGLNESTIQAFPTFLYSKIKSHKGGSSGCSICLQEYTETDCIRLLPECGHFFHLKCVDPWLRIHPSCPICRNPPEQKPVDKPLAATQVAVVYNS